MDSNWKKMKYPKKVVKGSVKLYNNGLTLKRARKCISELFEIPVKSDSTIWYWMQRFGEEFTGVINGLADLLHCDETLLKTHKKRKYFYFWAIKCPKTKMIVAWHLSEQRTLYDAKLLFWEARRRFPIGYLPKSIRTDGMPAYPFAIHKVFAHEVEHDRFLSFKNHSNNVIENFFRCKHHFPIFHDIIAARKYMEQWVKDYNEEKLSNSETFIILRLKVILGHATKTFIPSDFDVESWC